MIEIFETNCPMYKNIYNETAKSKNRILCFYKTPFICHEIFIYLSSDNGNHFFCVKLFMLKEFL